MGVTGSGSADWSVDEATGAALYRPVGAAVKLSAVGVGVTVVGAALKALAGPVDIAVDPSAFCGAAVKGSDWPAGDAIMPAVPPRMGEAPADVGDGLAEPCGTAPNTSARWGAVDA